MSNEIQNYEEKHHMSPVVAMLLGLGIGVVGTVIVIAANEEKFGQAVRQTKKRARKLQHELGDRYEDAKNSTKERVAHVAESVEKGARKIGDKMHE